jgi:glycosyltransferase involved in cell wall biosynthesis
VTRLLVSGLVLDQPMGGVRRHNQELLPRLARLLRNGGGHLAVLAGKNGIAFELPEEVEVIPSAVPPRPIPMRTLRESKALERAAREGRFDLVHTAHLPAPRGLTVPFTITIHDLRSLEGGHSPFSRRMIARQVVGHALEHAARVFTVSEFTASGLRALHPAVEDKLALVPNAADHFDPLPRAAGEDAELLCLGHLEPRKNLELVVRALAEDPTLPPLRLAGAGKGAEEERLRGLARELGVRVNFHGPFDDAELPTLLATCAAVVFPSRLEGFGIPALEALRAGAPLAISTAGALREVVGEDVPRFDPDDVSGCARAIRVALGGEVATGPSPSSWDAAAMAWFEALPTG